MSRVIDDDDKTLDTIVEFFRSRGYIGELVSAVDVHNADKLAELLRAEVPNWWDGIDPDDYRTWVDCRVWGSGETGDARRLIRGVNEQSLFVSAEFGTYTHAEPFVKEQQNG